MPREKKYGAPPQPLGQMSMPIFSGDRYVAQSLANRRVLRIDLDFFFPGSGRVRWFVPRWVWVRSALTFFCAGCVLPVYAIK